MKALQIDEINQRMLDLEAWEYEDNAIPTSSEFENFNDAFSVMTRIAFEVEKLNHHPDWSNVYNTLKISLSTHEANGVTEKDFTLAKIIDDLVS